MKKLMLLATAVMVLGLIGAGCGAATPQVVEVEKIVEKPVIQTVVVTEEKVVEKTKVETVVVEKEKVVEKPVEKVVEKVVTATPVRVAKPVTLNRNLGTEPPTVDPALATDTTSVEVDEQLFLGLTDLDDETAEVVPELATSWDVSEDGTVYTFHMRDDAVWVRYNPGTGEFEEVGPVTAHDVEYGVKRTLNPETASDYSYVLYIIKNGQAFNEGQEGITADDVGVRALDDYTVEFTLEHAAPFFPAIASMWVARPMPRDVIEEKGDRWQEPGFIITNGPYALAEWIHGDRMTLVKNPLWYGWKDPAIGPGNIERIEYVMITEASTEFALYENNQLDTSGVPQPDIPRVKADPVLSKEYRNVPILCTYYYGFTMTKPPVDDVRVRKALSAAIDRQTLIDTVTLGDQIPAHSFAPKGIFGNVADDPSICPWCLDYEMGLEMGKAWLEEAGYPNGKGLEITLMHNVSEGHARIAQAIQAMWKEAYPEMNVTIETQEWKVYLQTIRPDTPIEDVPHVWRLGWCADYTDQNNWVHEVFSAEAGANNTRAMPSRFEELTAEAGRIQDAEKRKELYAEAEKLLVEEEARIAPIYYYTSVGVTKPWLKRTFASAGGTEHIHLWTIDWAAKQAATGQ